MPAAQLRTLPSFAAGLCRLLSGEERDASAYVRQTVAYALWSVLEHPKLRSEVSKGDAATAVLIPALNAALEDTPSIASLAAISLSELMTHDDEAFAGGPLRAAWGLVPKLIARIDAPRDDKARLDDLRDMRNAFDSLIQVR